MASQALESDDTLSLPSLPSTSREGKDDDDDSDSPLPEYVPNNFSNTKCPTLVLISHGHSPPLNPPPRLSFDVRSLENPPKHIRDSHNGTSKRLQEWTRQDSAFITRRDAIASEIQRVRFEVLEGEKLVTESAEFDEEEAKEGHELPASIEPELRVGVNCQMGRHRSVAMVEELAKMSWPGWDVRVEHRDIEKKRRDNNKKGGRHGREARGSQASKFASEEGW